MATALGTKNRAIMSRLGKNAFANSTYAPAKKSNASTSAATIAPRGVGIQNPNANVQGGTAGTGSVAPKLTSRTISPGVAATGLAAKMQPIANAVPMAAASPNQQFQAAATTGSTTGYNDAAQGGFNNPGDPWTGFAARYTPASADTLLSNPSQVFYDYLLSSGLAQQGGDMGLIKSLEPYGDIAPLLYALTNSSRQNFGSREGQVNFLADFANNMTTPGGQDLSIQGLNSAVYNNPYAQDLYRTGNDAQNVQQLNQLLSGNAGLSFNPWLQKMVGARNDQAAYDYLSGRTQGQTGGAYSSYDQFLRSRGGPGNFYG